MHVIYSLSILFGKVSLFGVDGAEFVPSFYRCAGAGHLRDDILHFSEELQKFPNDDDEQRACIMDMGIKALRLVCMPQQLDITSINFFLLVLILFSFWCNSDLIVLYFDPSFFFSPDDYNILCVSELSKSMCLWYM